MRALKTIDIADDTSVIVNGSTINYAEGGYRYMVRFPAKPVATITERAGPPVGGSRQHDAHDGRQNARADVRRRGRSSSPQAARRHRERRTTRPPIRPAVRRPDV